MPETKPLAPSQSPTTPAVSTPGATSATPAGASGTTQAKPAPALYPSVDDIMAVYRGHVNRKDVEKNWPIVAKAMVAANMISKNQLVGFLTTIAVECAFKNQKEGTSKYTGQYDPYRGRGFIQATHLKLYQMIKKVFGVDVVNNPDIILQDTELSAKISCWYWSGGPGNKDIRPYAEKGDWANCRSIVNAGSPGLVHRTTQPGTRHYLEACQKAVAYFKSGLDPTAVGAAPMPSNYGLGCIDTGDGTTRTLNATGATTPLDALSYALGIQALDNQRSHILRCALDVSSQPDILKLDAQVTFEGKGFGQDLDGTFTVDEVVFYFGRTLEADLVAYRPDPNAPKPQVFGVGDSGQIAAGQQAQADAAQPAPAAGDIPAKIWAAAQSNREADTAAGPDGGRNGCAYALNKFCIIPAGLKMLGAPIEPWGVPVAVAACEAALTGGRGRKITRAEAVPGDIWIQPGKHIGVCSAPGCAKVLSNSSGKHKFRWEDGIEAVNAVYGGRQENLYRVLN